MTLVKLFVIGYGNRGQAYSQYCWENPNLCEVVGVAEPRAKLRQRALEKKNSVFQGQGQQEFLSFTDWKEALAAFESNLDHYHTLIDAILICVQDALHREVCCAFAKLKFAILLEKPMATNISDCMQIYNSVSEHQLPFAVGHVMRYSALTQFVKNMVEGGSESKVGKIISVQHTEPVGYFHYAHSYVRGNWKKEEECCFMLMTKSCHDIDWLCYILQSNQEPNSSTPITPLFVSSFGSLQHFTKENKPPQAKNISKCLDCPVEVESQCAFSAKKIYLDRVKQGIKTWPVHIIVPDGDIPDIENVTKALETTDYGKCVYGETGNNVVDNQVVNLQFSNGATVSFTMIAFSREICERKTRIYGTKGELEIIGNEVIYYNFLKQENEKWDFAKLVPVQTNMKNHGFADYYLMKQFIEAVQKKQNDLLYSNASETLLSHLLVFCCEEARIQSKVIHYPEWFQSQQSNKK